MKSLVVFASLSVLMGINMAAYAGLEPLDNQQLQSAQAQGAATIDWSLTLNQTSLGVFDNVGANSTCANPVYCRLAVSLNNRYDDKSYIGRNGQAYNAAGIAVGNTTNGEQQVGRKQWLVFKGIQGSIRLQGVELDGTDLTYLVKGSTTATTTKAALQFAFDAAKPIEIRNLGSSALAIETDELNGAGVSAGDLDGDGANNTPGYLAKGTYTVAGFDNGKETGFTGLNMNGNLALQGTVKIFSCDGTHPRC